MVPTKKKIQKNKNTFNKAKIDKKALDNIILEINTQEKTTKIIAVTKNAHIVKGRRLMVIPFVLKFNTVTI